jgi:hypothetical protein
MRTRTLFATLLLILTGSVAVVRPVPSEWRVGDKIPFIAGSSLDGQPITVRFDADARRTVLCLFDASRPPSRRDEDEMLVLMKEFAAQQRWYLISTTDIGLLEYSRHLRRLTPQGVTIVGGLHAKLGEQLKSHATMTLLVVESDRTLRFVATSPISSNTMAALRNVLSAQNKAK